MKPALFLFALCALAIGTAYCFTTGTVPGHDSVILLRGGEARKSVVGKTGSYCTVGWYKSIDNFMLRRDGLAFDGPFSYKWTLYEWGTEQDQKWFDASCKEPPK